MDTKTLTTHLPYIYLLINPSILQDTDLDVSILTVHLGKIQFAQLSGSTGAALPDPGVTKQELQGDDVPDMSSSSADEYARYKYLNGKIVRLKS